MGGALVRAGRCGGRARGGSGRTRPKTMTIVHVAYEALLRGALADGEVCEIVGYGPIATSAVHDLIASGDPFLAAVVTKGQQVQGVAHLGRRLDVPLPTTAVTNEFLTAARGMGLAKKDFAVVFNVLAQMAGVSNP